MNSLLKLFERFEAHFAEHNTALEQRAADLEKRLASASLAVVAE